MLTSHDNVIELDGPVTFATLCALQAAAEAYVAKSDLTVDWSKVSHVDSVALSLVFSWLRASRAANHRIRHVNLPPSLTSLAQLYGVSELLSAA